MERTVKYKLDLHFIPEWFDWKKEELISPIIEIPRELHYHMNHFETLITGSQFRADDGVPWPVSVTFNAPLLEGFDPASWMAHFEVGNRWIVYQVQHRYEETQKLEYDITEGY